MVLGMIGSFSSPLRKESKYEMGKWHLWIGRLGWFLLTSLIAWYAVWAIRPTSRRAYCFAITLAFIWIAYALSYLRGRKFWTLKFCCAILVGFAFWRFNIAFSRDDMAFLVFAVCTQLIVSILPPMPRRSHVSLGNWWSATKRTVRRLRGDWSEDDERFYSEIRNGTK
jgi:hypothetical protein